MFMRNAPPMNATIYREKYAELKSDGLYYYKDLTETSITKSFNPVNKNPIITQTFRDAFSNGTYYNPANKHYDNSGTVQCDMCKMTNLSICIGHQVIDLCMDCVSKIQKTVPVTSAKDYWIGPYNVRVPNTIKSVVASDDFNIQYKEGGVTEKGRRGGTQMTPDLYRQQYAELKDDGFYYYKEKTLSDPVPNYWIGPYDVRVSNNIDSVVGSDGYNKRNKNGGQTEMFLYNAPPMNEAIYRQQYAELKNDGFYYYKEKSINDILPNYWIGPYGVRVNNNIVSVIASDGYNMKYKCGGETEMGMDDAPPMNETLYKSFYADLKDDGFYYYKEKPVLKLIKPQKQERKLFNSNGEWIGVIFDIQNDSVKQERIGPNFNDYWFGPFNVLVPKTVHFVVSANHNMMYQDGSETQCRTQTFKILKNANGDEQLQMQNDVYSEAEYKNKYTEYRDGYYYYKVITDM